MPQALSPDEAWGPTDADREACREKIATLRNEGVFTPPSAGGSLIIPGNIGGLHWGGVAFDPAHGLLIVPANRLPAIVTLVPADEYESYKDAHPDQETTRQRGAPFAMSRTFLRSPSGLPCSPPPFGTLTAIDAKTGKVRWEVPLGKMPSPKAPADWGSINLGGPLATAGGIVFIGASMDPTLRAFDIETGDEVWKGELPASARSVPASFTAPDGKQYVVVAAGGHSAEFGPLDNAVVAFRLP
ncbi:MAG: PQQ-binding-like beta-propeller repeat protein [Bryobacterales bacterium]